ncbi:UNVERIFIED_ORG: hypothetical protein GGI57_004540 [Rhizobium aethiopicum]
MPAGAPSSPRVAIDKPLIGAEHRFDIHENLLKAASPIAGR